MIVYHLFSTLVASPSQIPFVNLKPTQQHTSKLQVLLHESYLVYIIRFRCLRPGDADVALLGVLKSYIFRIYVTDCEVNRLVFCYLLLVRRVCRI